MSQKITIIKPIQGIQFNFRDLWDYRELFLFFAFKDIKLRYRHFVIAFGWTTMPPLLMSNVFNLSLGKVIQTSLPHIPYLLFVFLGLIFWNLYSSIVFRASGSLLNNQILVTKTYFPRILLPLSSTIVCLVDFLLVFGIFGILSYIYKIQLTVINLIYFIPAILITFLFGTGLGIFFSALNIKYKDIRELLPLITSLLFFLTPVIYPVKLVSNFYYPLLYLNPMMGVIDTIRTALFESVQVNFFGLLVSTISALIFFFLGIVYFKLVENELTDII